MDLHYSRMEHQKELERECGVDINYLNIIFKKEIGKTLYHYILGVRMEHAKFLLETTRLPVTDIAKKMGTRTAIPLHARFAGILEGRRWSTGKNKGPKNKTPARRMPAQAESI